MSIISDVQLFVNFGRDKLSLVRTIAVALFYLQPVLDPIYFVAAVGQLRVEILYILHLR